MFETISLKHPCIKMRQKICRRTLFKYIGSKFGLQHQHQRLAVVGRDCTRRCRQCLCPRAAGAARRADGRALCALSIPSSSRNISLGRTLLFAAHFAPAPQGLSRVEGLCRAGAGRCCNPAAATNRARSLCHSSRCVCKSHPGFNIHAPHVGLCTEM